MEWQPIETAPKDGTEILLYETVEKWGKGYIFSGAYDETRNEKVYGTKWKCLEYDAFNRYPTHWMPLPKPPSLKS